MRLLADMHISPETVGVLRSLGHDVVRVNEVAPASATDEALVELALRQNRAIFTQDLDFSEIIALRHGQFPSLISLRLSSSRVEYVNSVLRRALPRIEDDVATGVVVVVKDDRIRR